MPNRPQEKSLRSIPFIRLCNLYFLKNALRKIPRAATGIEYSIVSFF